MIQGRRRGRRLQEPRSRVGARVSMGVTGHKGGRFSRFRKEEAILRLIRGEDLETLSRELGVTAATLSGWRTKYTSGGQTALLERARRQGRRERSAQGQDRRADDGQRAARAEDRPTGGRPPFGLAEVEAMSRAISPSSSRPYGLALVSRVWHIARSTVYAQRCIRELRGRGSRGPPSRPGRPMRRRDAREAIREVLAASPFHGEGYRKVWARLRFAGLRTSKRRVLRVMREAGLTTHRRLPRRTPSPRRHDRDRAARRDVGHGPDGDRHPARARSASSSPSITAPASAWASTPPSAAIASRPSSRSARRRGNTSAATPKDIAHDLRLRHDHGSPYVSDDFQRELAVPRHRQLARVRA